MVVDFVPERLVHSLLCLFKENNDKKLSRLCRWVQRDLNPILPSKNEFNSKSSGAG